MVIYQGVSSFLDWWAFGFRCFSRFFSKERRPINVCNVSFDSAIIRAGLNNGFSSLPLKPIIHALRYVGLFSCVLDIYVTTSRILAHSNHIQQVCLQARLFYSHASIARICSVSIYLYDIRPRCGASSRFITGVHFSDSYSGVAFPFSPSGRGEICPMWSFQGYGFCSFFVGDW